MEIECTIEGFKDCKTKKGLPFWKILTNQGEFNCFKEDVKDLVKEYLDGMCTLVLEEKNGYKSVIGIKDTPLGHNPAHYTKSGVVNNNKMTTMYTSYAKDVFIALIDKGVTMPDTLIADMDRAIALVKQAKEAFS